MLPAGYRFRQPTPRDTASFWELDQRCFAPGIAYQPAEIRLLLQPSPGAFQLALDRLPDGGAGAAAEPPRLAAFILARRRRDRGHVITLDVDAEHRRRGLGQALLAAAERFYAGLGLIGMRLEAAAANATALRFYALMGYRIARVLPGYYARDLDGLLFQKDFKPELNRSGRRADELKSGGMA